MIGDLLVSMLKFAMGGGSGVVVGYLSGLVLSDRGYRYRKAAALGYAAGFFVNYGVQLALGNLRV